MNKSALFVDFDNAYICLKNIDSQQAEFFATRPLDWITELMEERKLLVRRCYLNPASFGKYRPFFIAAGFDVVDCPPVTAQGKTAADMHMLMDMLDKLQHSTRFEEFIIFSGDSDFAPVLKRLREHDRETSIVHFAPISSAYRAAADNILQIGFGALPTFQTDTRKPSNSLPSSESGGGIHFVPINQRQELADVKKEQISNFIIAELERSSKPIAAAILSGRLQDQFGDDAAAWFGRGKISALFEELSIYDQNVNFDPKPPGRVYLKGIHLLSDPADWTISETDQEIVTLARKVCSITDTPSLSKSGYRECFEFLSDKLSKHESVNLTEMSRSLRDFATTKGMVLSRGGANSILFLLQANGISLRAISSAKEIASAYVKAVIFQCSINQWELNETEKICLKKWLSEGLEI